MNMTKTERRLFEESIIRKCKVQFQSKKKPSPFLDLIAKLRKITPINIILGIIACAFVVVIKGWASLFYVFLTGVIWITITSTVLTAILKSK